jgi:hypothetical protein
MGTTKTLKRDCDLGLARSVVARPPCANQDGLKLGEKFYFFVCMFWLVLTDHIC